MDAEEDLMSYKEVYDASMADPNGFWLEQAKSIDWDRFPTSLAA